MRAPISLVLALGLGVVSPVARAAEPAPSPEVRAVQLQTLFTEAQLHVDRYNSTRDSKHLVVARELLAQWLVDHRALYGDSKEAIAQRSTIEQQLGMIDADVVGHLTRLLDVAIQNRHSRTAICENLGTGSAYTAGPAGDRNNLSGKLIHRLLPTPFHPKDDINDL